MITFSMTSNRHVLKAEWELPLDLPALMRVHLQNKMEQAYADALAQVQALADDQPWGVIKELPDGGHGVFGLDGKPI